MRFRKMLLALFACMALGAVAANAASAEQWTVGTEGTGPGTTLSSETVSVSGGPWTLSSTVLGTTVELHAESVSCTSGVECKIFGAGESSGKLTYNNVTVVKPANCTVPGGSITTNALKDKVIMDPTAASSTVFDKFEPVTGTTFVEIEFGGELCALEGLVAPVAGTVTGEASHATGFLSVQQSLTFGAAQQKTGGGKLTLGSNEATLTGTAVNVLSGANKGSAFGTDE